MRLWITSECTRPIRPKTSLDELMEDQKIWWFHMSKIFKPNFNKSYQTHANPLVEFHFKKLMLRMPSYLSGCVNNKYVKMQKLTYQIMPTKISKYFLLAQRSKVQFLIFSQQNHPAFAGPPRCSLSPGFADPVRTWCPIGYLFSH